MKRVGNNSHFEQAVEKFLQEQKVPYIAINEGKKILVSEDKIKNFDLMLLGKKTILTDIKGRKFGYESAPKNLWENWISNFDLFSLDKWSTAFSPNGEKTSAYLLYAYCLPDIPMTLPDSFIGNSFYFGDRVYAFFVINITDYSANCKPRSNKPPAVCVSRKLFKTLLRPLSELLAENKI